MRRWAYLALLMGLAATMGCGGDADPCASAEPGDACRWLGVAGEPGFDGEAGLRYETRVNQVQDLVFLPDGDALFSDLNNHLVRRVGPDGIVETAIGWSDPIFPGDGPLGGAPEAGAPGTDWQLTHPTALLLRADGDVLIAAWHNYKVLSFDPASGTVRRLAGGDVGFEGDGGPALQAKFRRPNDLTYDAAGNLYVVDQQNQRVRRIDPAGQITTFAGDGAMGTAGDGGPATDAELSWADTSSPNPSGSVVHHAGKLYVADTEAHRVRVIDLATGVIDAFAGTGEPGYAGDGGPAAQAQLQGPRDLEIGPDGDLYFADTDNGAVRAIDLDTGVIRTVAGTGELGLDDDAPRPATETHLRRPFGVAFDSEGALYVMDSLNERVMKVLR